MLLVTILFIMSRSWECPLRGKLGAMAPPELTAVTGQRGSAWQNRRRFFSAQFVMLILQPVFELGASGAPIPGGALGPAGFDEIFKVAPGCDT